jgi:hypothetical protein
MLSLLSLLIALSPHVRADDTTEDEYDDHARVMRLSLVKGEVTLRRDGADEWERARLNLPLVEGDTIATGPDSHAEVQVDARNFVRLGQNTVLAVTTLRDEGIALSLSEGTATLRLARFDREREYFEIDAPKTTVAAEREGLYRLDVSADGGVRITVRGEGRARVYSESSGFDLRGDRTARLAYDSQGEGDWELSAAPVGDWWDAWVDERERHLAARLRFDGRERYYDADVWGAEDLDLYGDWHHTREYGYVWRPHVTVVNNYHNWAPYRHGHWSWVQPYGWTWVPDEDWGWAPYHYGRWVHVNNTWCWAPRGYGYEYRRARWRPALVAFININTSRGQHIAWYPLTHGQRDPRGRYWRRDRDRFSPHRPHERGGYGRLNPALVRAVTSIQAREFGDARGRGRAAASDIAQRVLDSEPLTGSPPVIPARLANRRADGRGPRVAGAPRNDTGGAEGLVVVRPEAVQPSRPLPSRRTGASPRTPGVALNEQLRRTRVFNNREPRVAAPAPNNGAAGTGSEGTRNGDDGLGAFRRPGRNPRRLPPDAVGGGAETEGARPRAVRPPRPDTNAGDETGGETEARPSRRARRPGRTDEPGQPDAPRSRPDAERPDEPRVEGSSPRAEGPAPPLVRPAEREERPRPPARRDEPRTPRANRPDVEGERHSSGGDTPREASPPRRERPRHEQPRPERPRQEQPRQEQPRQEQPRQEQPRREPSQRNDGPREQPPRVSPPPAIRQERPAPRAPSGEPPRRGAPRAEKPQRDQTDNRD